MLRKGQSSGGGLRKGAVLIQAAWNGHAHDPVLSSPKGTKQPLWFDGASSEL